jgi:hypothetical protein
MMSLRRYYHRRFGYQERFHLAVILTIIVVAYVAVPVVVRYIDALQGYAPAYYEPKDSQRQEWLTQRGIPEQLTHLDLGVIVDIVLFVLVAIVWLTVMPIQADRRRPPPR